MLKLVYDLKAGFEDCYLTIKDEEYDLSSMLEIQKISILEFSDELEDDGVLVELDKLGPSEEEFYKEYCNNVEGLLAELEERGELDMLHEDSVLNVSKVFFSHLLGGTPIKNTVPVWEPSNFRLVWEPWTRSSCYYLNAMSASDVCMLLNLTRQQLHYYVTTGAIKKEFNPENSKQFKYNRTDVYVLQKKLEKKYDRYK
jgi:hypothetical protein